MTRSLLMLSAAACIAAAVAACSPPTSINVEGARISVRSDGSVQLRPADGGRAEIAPDGALTLDGEPVELTAAQQALLSAYHADLIQMREGALDIARQGVALGGKAASEAIRGVLGGNPGDVKQKVESDTAQIEAEGEKLRVGAMTLKARQREVAREVPQLRRYLLEDDAELAEALADGDPA